MVVHIGWFYSPSPLSPLDRTKLQHFLGDDLSRFVLLGIKINLAFLFCKKAIDGIVISFISLNPDILSISPCQGKGHQYFSFCPSDSSFLIKHIKSPFFCPQ